jgi:hypothetical protein
MGRLGAEAKAAIVQLDPKALSASEAVGRSVFQEFNITDAKQQSLAMSAAYALASAREPGSVLNRTDVINSIATLGLNNPDDVARTQMIDQQIELMRDTVRRTGETIGRPVGEGFNAAYDSYRREFPAQGRGAATPPGQLPRGVRNIRPKSAP